MDDATNLPLSYAFVVCFVVTRKKTTKNTTKASSLSLLRDGRKSIDVEKNPTTFLLCQRISTRRGEKKRKQKKQ